MHFYALKSTINNTETIRQLNEKLAQTRKQLKETEENAKLQKEAFTQMSELTDAMLDRLRALFLLITNLRL